MKTNAWWKEYRSRPGEAYKYYARVKCANAIRDGKLVRLPCEKCGASKTHAHHPNYSKPLEVQWLCPPCHNALHRKFYRKIHCKHGHAMTADNTRINSKGTQCCIICARADDRKYKQRKHQQLTQQNGEIL